MNDLRREIFICLLLSVLGAASVSGDVSSQSAKATNSPASTAASVISAPAVADSTKSSTLTNGGKGFSTNTPKQYVQEDYDVRRFLEEAPPLKKVVYGIDATTFLGVRESEKEAMEHLRSHLLWWF